MIYSVSTTAVSTRCPSCHAINSDNYADLTLGIDESPRSTTDGLYFIPLADCGCGSEVVVAAAPTSVYVSKLCANYIATRVKATGSMNSDYTEAQYTAMYGDSYLISTYESLTFSLGINNNNGGKLHLAAALAKMSRSDMTSAIKSGVGFYGTEAAIKSAINMLCTTDAERDMAYKQYGYVYK